MLKCFCVCYVAQCHKAVTQRKYSRLQAWTGAWLRENVSAAQADDCTRWMLGRGPDSRPNRTAAQEVERWDLTPYRVFTRYRVDWVAPASGRTSPANTN